MVIMNVLWWMVDGSFTLE